MNTEWRRRISSSLFVSEVNSVISRRLLGGRPVTLVVAIQCTANVIRMYICIRVIMVLQEICGVIQCTRQESHVPDVRNVQNAPEVYVSESFREEVVHLFTLSMLGRCILPSIKVSPPIFNGFVGNKKKLRKTNTRIHWIKKTIIPMNILYLIGFRLVKSVHSSSWVI